MNPSVYLAKPDMKVPLRRIPVYDYQLAVAYVIDLDLVAVQKQSEARLACDQAGWLHVSSDGGSSYDPVSDSVQTGVDLGPLAAGDRVAIKLKVLIPALTAVRRRFVDLNIGRGVG